MSRLSWTASPSPTLALPLRGRGSPCSAHTLARSVSSLPPRGRAGVGLSATFLLALSACTDTGQSRTTFPISAAGHAPETIAVGDWDVTVREARVAFGPVYLCESQNAGLDACASAAAEHLSATSFDALSDAPTPMGTMTGTSGATVLSGMWDYGRSWRLSETEPRALAGAVDGSHSAVIEISAVRRVDDLERVYRFTLDVDGGTQPSGTTATRARLTEHQLVANEPGLVVRFDPTLWASMLDYDALVLLSPGSGTVALDADAPESNALVIALTTTGLPSFEWQVAD